MLLWKRKHQHIFCGHNVLTESVFVICLAMQESQFDELCGLQQIAIA